MIAGLTDGSAQNATVFADARFQRTLTLRPSGLGVGGERSCRGQRWMWAGGIRDDKHDMFAGALGHAAVGKGDR